MNDDEEEEETRQRSAARRILEAQGRALDSAVESAESGPAAPAPAQDPSPLVSGLRDSAAEVRPPGQARLAEPETPLVEQRSVHGAPGTADRLLPGRARTESAPGARLVGRREDGRRIFEVNGQQYPVPDNPGDLSAVLRRLGVADPASSALSILQGAIADPPARPRRRVVPPGTVTVNRSATVQAPVSPEAALQSAAAQREYESALARAQADEVNAARIAAEGENRRARLELEGAQDMAREAEDRRSRMAQRMSAFDDTIQRVQNNRIDPDAFYGGDFSRRLGAGIIVALGGIGSAIGGGENQGLAVIERLIDRNIRAQEANQANARAGAGLEGQALGQFRAMLGDEEAAMAATRAAHLAAASQAVSAQLANARPDQVQHLQALAGAVEQRAAAARAVAESRARMTTEYSVNTTERMGVSAATRRAFGIARRQLTPMEQEQFLESQARQRATDIAAQGPNGRRIRNRSRRIHDRVTRPRGPAAAGGAQTGQGGQGGQQTTGRPAPSSSQRRPGQEPTWTREAINSAVDRLSDEREARQDVGMSDFEAMGGTIVNPDRYASSGAATNAELRARIESAVVALHQTDDIFNRIEELRRDRGLWSAMTEPDRNSTLAQLGHQATRIVQVANDFGAVGAGREMDRLVEMTGDPTRTAWGDLMRLSPQSTDAHFRSLRRSVIRDLSSQLRLYGIQVRNARGQIYADRGNPGGLPEQRVGEPEQLGVSEAGGALAGAYTGALAGAGLGPAGVIIGGVGGAIAGARANSGDD